MRHQRNTETSQLTTRAKALGWFSIGLGAAELAAPSALSRIIGVRYDARSGTTLRALGLREIGTGIAILARPRTPGLLWARVAGDLMDLALLATGFSRKQELGRLALATAAVAGVTVIDALTARQLGRETKEEAFSVTVRTSLEEARQRWPEFAASQKVELEEVEFAPAPGDRGTEIRAVGGERCLRHFKQFLETGEILHSDASIHQGPHPARPAGRMEGR